jgi:O-antigen ligase
MPVLLESRLAIGAFILLAFYCFCVIPRALNPDASSRMSRLLALIGLGLLCFVVPRADSWELSDIQESLILLVLAGLCDVFLYDAKKRLKRSPK